MIVDTSFVLDVIDDLDAAVSKEQELEVEGVPLVIPAMTVLELYIGVGMVANTQEERRKVETVLESYTLWIRLRASAGEWVGFWVNIWPTPTPATALESGKATQRSQRRQWNVMSLFSLATPISEPSRASPSRPTSSSSLS